MNVRYITLLQPKGWMVTIDNTKIYSTIWS